MRRKIVVSLLAVAALACAVPAFAGGDHCSGAKSATAWGGACLQRSADGALSVAEVAAGSPAARAGLKAGDIVVAVNGKRVANAKESGACSMSASSCAASCTAGAQMTYTVRRGTATKDVKLKLVPMSGDAAERFANRGGVHDAQYAALVIPATK
ncbi:MAG: PDZ domain-containing protein [Candidatus Eisenbacteria bacterium]